MERAVWLAISRWTCFDHTCDIGRYTALVLHMLGLNKAYTNITLREMHSSITLFLCVICIPMANKASPTHRSGVAAVQDPGGVYDWRSWSKKASDQVLYRSSVSCNSFCPTLHRAVKEQERGRAGKWVTERWSCCLGRWWVPLARDGGGPSAVPGHVLGYRGERRGAFSPWKLWGSCSFLPLLSWQVPWKHRVETTQNICSGECPTFSKPAVIFVQAKTTQQVCPELANGFSCPQTAFFGK